MTLINTHLERNGITGRSPSKRLSTDSSHLMSPLSVRIISYVSIQAARAVRLTLAVSGRMRAPKYPVRWTALFDGPILPPFAGRAYFNSGPDWLPSTVAEFRLDSNEKAADLATIHVGD